MLTISNSRWLAFLGLGLLGSGPLAAHAQYSPNYTPPPPPLSTAPCVPTKKDPCPAPTPPAAPAPASSDQFPFPGDSATPNAPASTSPAPSSDKFAFPGEPPATPASPPADKNFAFPGEPPATGSSSSSSSSGSGPDPDTPNSTPAPAPAAAVPRPARRKLPKVQQSVSDREAEDLDVSHFYLQSGNFLGAYMRAQDAVKSIPDDADAHFALAEAAQKLKKNDEAITEFKTYLKMMPGGGDHTRAAENGLAELHVK